jgi:hypothetical protein
MIVVMFWVIYVFHIAYSFFPKIIVL